MSADNGIYVGIFPDGELRVIHAQAIENLRDCDGGEDVESIVFYFEDAKVFFTLTDAYMAAHQWERNMDILEYGVSTLVFSKPFHEYEKLVNMKVLPKRKVKRG